MTVFSGLLGKVQNLVGKAVTRKTVIYDPSKNRIVVGELTLDGVTDAVLNQGSYTKQEVGTSRSQYTYYDNYEGLTLTVQVLPTAQCITGLQSLAQVQYRTKGWFYISYYDNGELVGKYKAHLITQPNVHQSATPDDRTYVFGLYEIGLNIQAEFLSDTSLDYGNLDTQINNEISNL